MIALGLSAGDLHQSDPKPVRACLHSETRMIAGILRVLGGPGIALGMLGAGKRVRLCCSMPWLSVPPVALTDGTEQST